MPEEIIPQNPHGIIYKATNSINGKVYVGQTKILLRDRIVAHLSQARCNAGHYFHAAIRKYGQDAFAFEAIDSAVDAADLNAKEIHWITALDCRAPNGYNMSPGGDGGRERSPHDMKFIGQKFGRLTVVEPDGYKHGRPWWKCQCECGVVKPYLESAFTSGNTKSCGCGKVDAGRKLGLAQRKHTPQSRAIRRKWSSMKSSCKMKYAGTGITMCTRWRKLEHFLADMNPSYSPGMDLIRINRSGIFEPGNCKWGKMDVHAPKRPSRRATFLTFNGITKSQRQWARDLNISFACLYSRVCRYGWSAERALTEPVGSFNALNTKECREKTRQAHIGLKPSDETRKKMRDSRLRYIANHA